MASVLPRSSDRNTVNTVSWQWDDNSLAQLATFLAGHGIGDGAAMPDVVPIGDGHSNLTYRVDVGERAIVLRRPPPPPFPPGSNDVLREARIISALNSTEFPVPVSIATGQEGALFDVPFYVMSLVDGEVITVSLPQRFNSPAKMGEIGHELIAVLAALHLVDWQGIGLGSLGKPDGFNARHVQRMASLLTEEALAEHPDLSSLQRWLEDNCPTESGAALIHNDCRIGNVMWAHGDTPRIATVLDWELATIGDPLLDLAYTLTSLPRDGQCRQPVQDLASACLGEGFPTPAKLVDHYSQLTGKQPTSLAWYMAMVNWKLAILYGYSRRKGMDPYYEDDSHVPRFLAEGRFHAEQI
jgi:aminoglycoside phosphotransferase (APT) family kinase protein